MNILQVSTSDIKGGAAKVAWNGFQSYRMRGFPSYLAVGRKFSADSDVLLIPNDACRSQWARIWLSIGNRLSSMAGKERVAGQLRHVFHWAGQFKRLIEIQRGYEDFDFPGTWRLLDLPQKRPDIVHCHNLHGDYFDLRALPWLSRQVPVVLTLHDTWLLSGHCAYSLDCQRWRTGCGDCPYPDTYPRVLRDETAGNWQRKQEIYKQSSLFISTPCRWLMEKVEQSMLAPAVAEARIIPYGVDLSVFKPADKQETRTTLGIPQDAKVLLFAANGIRSNIWKDYQTLRAAVGLLGERLQKGDIRFLALGEDAPSERIGSAEIQFVPYQGDLKVVARYYQIADIYLHAARVEADTFPNVVLEALACGTPVVATAVGGIPEQVKGVRSAECGMRNENLNQYPLDEATGILVPPQDPEGMAAAIQWLLEDEAVCRKMKNNAAEDAVRRFNLNRQADEHLEWYGEIIEKSKR